MWSLRFIMGDGNKFSCAGSVIDLHAEDLRESRHGLSFHRREPVFGSRASGREHRAMTSQAPDVLEFLTDPSGEFKGVAVVSQSLQDSEGFRVSSLGVEEMVQGGLRGIIEALEAGADPDGLDQAHRGLKEVHPEAQLVAVEVVHGLQGLRGIVAVPAQELAHMGPVLLLNVGIVVLLVGPAAGELDLGLSAVFEQMVVEEFAAVIGVQSAQGEGQGLADLLEGLQNAGFASSLHGPGFHPAGEDVGEVEGVKKLALGGRPGMGHQIHFHRARALDIPVVGLDGDLVPEQRARFGASVEAAFESASVGFQGPVEGAGADGEHLPLQGRGEAEALSDPGQPPSQDRFETHRPGIACLLPDGFDDAQEGQTVGCGPGPSRGSLRPSCGQGRGELPDGVLAVDPTDLAELIQDAPLVRLRGGVIPPITAFQVSHGKVSSHGFSSCLWRRGYLLEDQGPTVTLANGAMIPLSVTL